MSWGQRSSSCGKERCVAYRKVNEGSQLDEYPMPHIGERLCRSTTGKQNVFNSSLCSFTQLEVSTTDYSGNLIEGPQVFRINVIDQNDNRPIFKEPRYTGEVLEGSPTGTTVMTMTAFDADDPNTDNAVLRYNIVKQSPDKPSPNMFYIDAERGDIVTVIAPTLLDRETLPTTTYELEIMAKDMAGSEVGLTGTTTATITITDKNDHAPEFTHPLFEAHVYEGSTGVVVNLTVDDRDDPATAAWRAMYSIISGDPTQSFEIQTNPDNNEGMLSVVKPLNYEASEFLSLLIKVENEDPLVPDVGYGPSSTATVHVRVEDINEGPVFFPDPLIVTRMENIPVGSFVASLNATDPDILEKQSIRYAVLQDPAGWLSVNPVRGTVNTSASLDRESPYVYDNKYTAVFIATDNGTPPATGTGTLIIHLEDYNDNAPYVLPSVARVCEDAYDVTVAVVGGWDKDLPPNAAPFKIELGTQPDLDKTWNVTRVNSTHSQIRLLRSLKKDNYQLPLLITDSGVPPLSNNTEVKVQVCICNKNRMHCSSAHSHRASFLVPLATLLLTLLSRL
ncbi:LOW QUALITY PROTEIN: cadherin-13-like [Simochromis diagramma]|uniref:LOW QUALITY PROTEIN: cadherin-13-like n=1 Tax=Simochromis diagramma TaxID=43689 RepID=UPI001A7ECB03|nr:LOW QUALITY PROTEIN: cadherin-13-like [Simochromis diagramma]